MNKETFLSLSSSSKLLHSLLTLDSDGNGVVKKMSLLTMRLWLEKNNELDEYVRINDQEILIEKVRW